MTDDLNPPTPRHPPPLPRGQGETILLVEDQELMQVITARVLTQLGYHVLVAGTVPSGFRVWQEHAHTIKLLLTDYIFQGHLTGLDLVTKVHRVEPELPVLIVSGSWLPDAKKDPPLPPNVAYLAKPFKRSDIAHTVRRLLDERPTHPRSWVPRNQGKK